MALTAQPVAVYARPVRAGQAKTRLGSVLGMERAAALYAAFLEDTLATCERSGFDVTVWSAGASDDPDLVPHARGWPTRPQGAGDLGARMARTLATQIAQSGHGLIVGSDAPTLPARYLELAREALDSHDAVVGPAADRGYWLVGAARTVPPMFEGIRWSTPHVLDDTLAAAKGGHVRLALLPPWYDIDDETGLALLRAHLSVAPRAAPATARCLGLF